MNKNHLLKRISNAYLILSYLIVIVIVALLITIIALVASVILSRPKSNDLTYGNDTTRSKLINDYLELHEYPGLACATEVVAYNTLDSYAQFTCTIKKGYTLDQTKLEGTTNVGRFTFNAAGNDIKAAEYPSEVFYGERLIELLPTDVLKAYYDSQSKNGEKLTDVAKQRAGTQ